MRILSRNLSRAVNVFKLRYGTKACLSSFICKYVYSYRTKGLPQRVGPVVKGFVNPGAALSCCSSLGCVSSIQLDRRISKSSSTMSQRMVWVDLEVRLMLCTYLMLYAYVLNIWKRSNKKSHK